MLQVYTGTGKGKTTAALGAALRAFGHGYKTVVFSFLKDDIGYGEIKANDKLKFMEIYQVGRDEFVNFRNPEQIDLNMAKNGWEKAQDYIVNHKADLIILDEFNLVLAHKMLPVDEILNFIQKYQNNLEIITTGRDAPQKLIEIADLVTDMQEVKHYLMRGVSIRDGFDH